VTATTPETRQPELVPLAELKRHPRNYRQHPPAQIEHLAESFRQFGVLPTTVIARDGTILGGHGVYITAQRLGVPVIPATRLDLDPYEPLALKLMAALNFSDRLALDDESALHALLAEVAEGDATALLGSGWEDRDLAKLAAKLSATPPDDFRDYGEDVPVDYRCPHCGYEWSGPPR
jgi:ParB-like chromosome segregation protein Spo0J